MSRVSWWYSWYTSSQSSHMMASPRKKSSSPIFAPCMKLQSLIAFMYKSCSLRICVGRNSTISGGDKAGALLIFPSHHWSYRILFQRIRIWIRAPIIWSVVSFADCKNPRKPWCSWLRTTSGSIDCFYWAPSCGTLDDDDPDFLLSYDFLIERS